LRCAPSSSDVEGDGRGFSVVVNVTHDRFAHLLARGCEEGGISARSPLREREQAEADAAPPLVNIVLADRGIGEVSRLSSAFDALRTFAQVENWDTSASDLVEVLQANAATQRERIDGAATTLASYRRTDSGDLCTS
jgi:hypothetical protein